MAFDSALRIGAGNVERDDYGRDWTSGSSQTDMGKTSEDGIVINYSSEQRMVRSAQEITIEEIFLISEEMSIEMSLKAHLVENLALSFGHAISDITDDSVSTPKKKHFDFGARRSLPVMSFRFKIPQIASASLFDYFIIYRGLLVPAYSQTFKIQEERYIPVRIMCLGDSANSGAMGMFASEYSA